MNQGALGPLAGIVAAAVWELCGVSLEEYAGLASTIKAVHYEAFRCEKCLSRWPDTEDGRRRSDFNRRFKMGCFGSAEGKVFWKWAGLRYKTCPGNLFSVEAAGWLALWKSWDENGVLPFAGGLADQPAKAVEVLQVVSTLNERRKSDEKAKAKPKMKEE